MEVLLPRKGQSKAFPILKGGNGCLAWLEREKKGLFQIWALWTRTEKDQGSPQCGEGAAHCCRDRGLCDTTLVERRRNICLPVVDQSKDATKIQLCEPVIFTGVTYSNRGEGLPPGTEVTQKTAASPRPAQHGEQLMRAGSLEFIACCLQAAHSDALSLIQMARRG